MNKWVNRERKRRKKRYGMQVDGKSVFVVQAEIGKRVKKKKKKNAR